MKKTLLLTLLAATMTLSNAFASMTVVSGANQEPSNQKDYVGKIVAAVYTTENDQPKLMILTIRDKASESNLPALNFSVDGVDMQFGMTLASSIGKKIAVYGGANTNDRLTNIQLVTDEYWNGGNKK